MAKNPNSKSKPAKRDNSMYGAMIVFSAGFLAELYLLVIRRYYINGVVNTMLAWHEYLRTFAILGAAVLALGVVLSAVWRADKKKRVVGWTLTGCGAFLAVASLLIRMTQASAVTLFSVIVPVMMVLSVIWAFYERECSAALTVMSVSLVVLWVIRRLFSHVTLGMPMRVCAVVYLLLLAGLAWMAKNQKLDKFFPGKTDLLPIYIACGLSAAGVVLGLFNAMLAYYAMGCLGIALFALAVYYTVRLL